MPALPLPPSCNPAALESGVERPDVRDPSRESHNTRLGIVTEAALQRAAAYTATERRNRRTASYLACILSYHATYTSVKLRTVHIGVNTSTYLPRWRTEGGAPACGG